MKNLKIQNKTQIDTNAHLAELSDRTTSETRILIAVEMQFIREGKSRVDNIIYTYAYYK